LQKLEYENLPDLTAVWASLAFIAVYLLLMKGITFHKEQVKRTAVLILTIFIGFEMYAAGLANLMALDDDVVYTKRTTYRNHMDLYTPAFDKLHELDTSFYRAEKVTFKRTNDNLGQNVFGLSNSTSTLNADTIKLLQYLGLASKSHWSKYIGSTPATDSLLGIKYLVGENKGTLPEYYSEVMSENGTGEQSDKTVYAYHNPYAMSLAFGVSDSMASIKLFSEKSDLNNPFERLNGIYAAALGIDKADMFVNLKQSYPTSANFKTTSTSDHTKYTPIDKSKKSSVSYTITAETSDVIYMYIPSTYPRECNITVNGAKKGTYFGNETHRIVELGSYAPGAKLTVKLELKDDVENLYIRAGEKNYFYYFDEDVYLDLVTQLKNGPEFSIAEWNEDTLSGSINVTEGKELIMTTIPYDEGWKITADGKEVEIFEVLDSLIAFRLPAGEHALEMRYRPACAVYGSIISVTGIVIFIIACVVEQVMKKKNKVLAGDVPLPDADMF
ncbi:MAG: YfhO family protein, partial [Clostridia bacterium]|nr:YfhO family protein [Clostridia bacterium]